MLVVRRTRDAGILIIQPWGEMSNILGRLPGDLYRQHCKVEVRNSTIVKLSNVGKHLGRKSVSCSNGFKFWLRDTVYYLEI
jgi:hypothetical protein